MVRPSPVHVLERLSPYKLATCLILKTLISRSDLLDAALEPAHSKNLSLEEYRALGCLLQHEIGCIDIGTEKQLVDLLASFDAFLPGTRSRARARARLKHQLDGLDSADAVMDLLVALRGLLTPRPAVVAQGAAEDGVAGRPTHVDPCSLSGVFLRRFLLAFDSLGFDGVCILFDQVQQYTKRCDALPPTLEDRRTLRRLGVPVRSPNGDVSDDMSVELETSSDEVSVDDIALSLDRSGLEEQRPDEEELTGAAGLATQGLLGSGFMTPVDDGGGIMLSERQLQGYLEQLALQIPHRLASQVPFQDIGDELEALLQMQPELPRAHFARMLNCLEHGHAEGALDSLHRYFDYPARRGGPSPAQETPSIKKTLQYAALNLGALHFRLGHHELALQALNETVRVAQMYQDHRCVALALGWLHHLGEAQGGHKSGDVLSRFLSQAHAAGLLGLQSLGALSTAKQLARSPLEGSSVAPPQEPRGPAAIWDWLRASATGEVGGLLGLPPGQGGNQGPQQPGALPGGSAGLACKRLLLECTALQEFGYPELAATPALTVLQVYGESASAEEVVLAASALANHILRGHELPGAAVLPSAEPLQGEPADGTPRDTCAYAEALRLMNRVREVFPHPARPAWKQGVAILLHEWMVNRGELDAADRLGQALQSWCPPSQGPEVHLEARLQHIRLLCARERWREAVVAAEGVVALAGERGLALQQARALLQMADIALHSCPHDPPHALPHILSCLAVCDAHSLDTMHAAAMVRLASVHVALGAVRRARAMLGACLPHLCQHAPLQTQGQGWLALAKCHLATHVPDTHTNPSTPTPTHDTSSHTSSDTPAQPATRLPSAVIGHEVPQNGAVYRRDSVRSALKSLQHAVTAFSRCQDCAGLREAWYLTARAHHELGDEVAQRDLAAGRFNRVSQHLDGARTHQLLTSLEVTSLVAEEYIRAAADLSVQLAGS